MNNVPNGFIKEFESQTFENSAKLTGIFYENSQSERQFIAKVSINGVCQSGKRLEENTGFGNGRFKWVPNDGELIDQGWKKTKSKKNDNPTKRKYKMNRSRITALALAFSNLSASKKFMAFYSISFPSHLPDEICRKVFNTAATRARKQFGKFGYLAVCERQKNGTLHFHMLVNKFMNVRILNHFFAAAIHTQVQDVEFAGVSFDKTKYNGVDVRRVFNPTGCIKYLSKYLTKSASEESANERQIKGRPWFGSNSVSNLLTYIYLPDITIRKLAKKLITSQLEGKEVVKVVKGEYFTFYPFKQSGFQHLANLLNPANELIFASLNSG